MTFNLDEIPLRNRRIESLVMTKALHKMLTVLQHKTFLPYDLVVYVPYRNTMHDVPYVYVDGITAKGQRRMCRIGTLHNGLLVESSNEQKDNEIYYVRKRIQSFVVEVSPMFECMRASDYDFARYIKQSDLYMYLSNRFVRLYNPNKGDVDD